MLKSKKILVKISGSIAAYKSAYLVSKLLQMGNEVRVVMTKSAQKFVGTATFEGLTGSEVFSDTFEEGKLMSHIDLIKWCDLVISAPATANLINKMATGIGDDLVTSLFLAHDWSKPYFLAPAMNTNMFNHPSTKKSLKTLCAYGIKILPTEEGRLACGDIGYGKLLDPDKIIEFISGNKEYKSLKVIITAGGTRESIDGIRNITNLSTGKTASQIAQEFINNGMDVTYLSAEDAKKPEGNFNVINYSDFSSLQTQITKLLSENHFDIFIHNAAVSDYSISELKTGNEVISHFPIKKKISSEADEINLKLKKNPKIIDEIKSISKNDKIKLVGFKFLNSANDEEKREAVKKLQNSTGTDLIVLNDFKNRINNNQSGFSLWKDNSKIEDINSAENLSERLFQILVEENY